MQDTAEPREAWRVSEADFPQAGSSAEKLRFLLNYAVLAPSDHNTQPWTFTVTDDVVELHADRALALHAVDPHEHLLVISCGAALLNLRVALRRFGYADDCALFPDASDTDLIARIVLREGAAPTEEENAMFAAITLRRTTRAEYEYRGVSEAVQAQLVSDAAAEGAWLHVVQWTQRERVASLVAEGDRLQLSDKEFRREFSAWLHPNRSRARRGMRGYGWGLGQLKSLATPLVIRVFDVGKGRAAKDQRLAEEAPMLGVFGTDTDEPASWVATGQAMQRALLRAQSYGLTASYFNQPVEIDALRPRLARVIGRPETFPHLLVRFGSGPAVEHSPREPVSQVLHAS